MDFPKNIVYKCIQNRYKIIKESNCCKIYIYIYFLISIKQISQLEHLKQHSGCNPVSFNFNVGLNVREKFASLSIELLLDLRIAIGNSINALKFASLREQFFTVQNTDQCTLQTELLKRMDARMHVCPIFFYRICTMFLLLNTKHVKQALFFWHNLIRFFNIFFISNFSP